MTDASECPLCGSSTADTQYSFRDPDGAFEKPLVLAHCGECHLVYLVSSFEADRLYNQDYYGKKRGLPALVFEPFNRFWTDRKARRLRKAIPGIRWFDFGCGRGDVLLSLKRMGCEVWGLETQPEAIGALRREIGSHAVASLDDLPVQEGYFDAITMWHVLEHLDQPCGTLLRLRRLIAPGGRLFLAVPNWNSCERKLFGDRFFHLDVPRHRLHFTEETLRRLLGRTGWQVEKVAYNAWAYNSFGLFQTLLNLGPGPRNFFYNVCKRGAFPGRKPMDFLVGMVWTFVASVPAALITLLAIIPLTLLGKTGTIELFARNPEG